ncbi:MAG: DUF192 domain-containing protein [Candidatus Paceibacterota bacterium]|jgi:hypothetical protein
MGNKKVLIILGIVILAFIVFGYLFFGYRGGKLETKFLKVNGVEFSVEMADTTLSRMKGLSGRDGLVENEGMFFVFDSPANQGFWMKDMKFPIDIIWIKDGKIVGFVENAQPEPGKTVFGLKIYNSSEPVDRVLEVNAGTVAKYGFEVGQSVSF